MKKEEINEGKKPIIVAQCSNCMLEFTTWMSDSNECPECERKVNFMNTHETEKCKYCHPCKVNFCECPCHETESKKECIHSESWIKGKEICNDCLHSPAKEKPQEGWEEEFADKFFDRDGTIHMGGSRIDDLKDFIKQVSASAQREAYEKGKKETLSIYENCPQCEGLMREALKKVGEEIENMKEEYNFDTDSNINHTEENYAVLIINRKIDNIIKFIKSKY